MQPRNFYLQHPKSLPIFKNNTMTHRRRSSNNDEDDDNLGNLRQNLPRRCKSIQPYYGVDLMVEEEAHEFRTKREKVLGLPSGTKQAQGSQGRQPRRKLTITMIEKPKDKEEMMNFPTTIPSWLIEMKVVKEKEEVICFHGPHKEMIREGKLTKNGIICDCCGKIFSASNFSSHRDDHDLGLKKPYENIFLRETGVSLLTCQIEAWNRHSVPARSGYLHVVKRPRVRDHYDDCCVICADGGDLLCCENCPSTYHPKCMGFKVCSFSLLNEENWTNVSYFSC